MGIELSGCNARVEETSVTIFIDKQHPLIQLAGVIQWEHFSEIVVADLKRTTVKGFWWMGRKILVRVHLGAYFLQRIFDLTDRSVEYGIKDNAAYRLFCGEGIVVGWHPPDHTRIEEFRNRLSPETQRAIANEVAKSAVIFGFADPSKADFDSTVQEANITYPADANLMTKLVSLGSKVIKHLKEKTRGILPSSLTIDLKAIKARARAYFFMSKNTCIAKRRAVFAELHRAVKQSMRPLVGLCATLNPKQVARMPWNIRRAFGYVNNEAWRYLLDVAHFIRTHHLKTGKILSFHARAVACIKKGKIGKDKEFGRVYQLARIAGNFLFVGACTSLKMNDKTSFTGMLDEHALLFGNGVLNSAAADKGYWSAKNQRELNQRGVLEIGLQRPGNIKNRNGLPSPEVQDKLRDRRAGIEALIGRTKHGGQLGKSRMKSDAATLAAGYSSVLGFNLRQMIRHTTGKIKLAA